MPLQGNGTLRHCCSALLEGRKGCLSSDCSFVQLTGDSSCCCWCNTAQTVNRDKPPAWLRQSGRLRKAQKPAAEVQTSRMVQRLAASGPGCKTQAGTASCQHVC